MSDTIVKLIFAGVMLMLVFFGRETVLRYGQRAKPLSPTVSFAGGPMVAAATGVAPAIRPWNMVPSIPTGTPATAPGQSAEKPGGLQTKPASPPKPQTNSLSAAPYGTMKANASLYLISDLLRSDNIAEQNPQKRWPLASLTKLMTAVVVTENIPLQTPITISPSAEAMEGEGGGFKSGEAYSANDLLKALFMVSSNDAAKALAEFFGEEKFVEAMNRKALELGLADTFFKETTGLSPINQSTPNDLKALTRFIYERHHELLAYSQSGALTITELTTRAPKILRNINLFAGRPDFLGGKTGFIEDSGENLLSLFSRGGRPILIIVLDADNRFRETESLLKSFDARYRQ